MWSVAPHWFLSGRQGEGKKLWKCVNVWIGLQLTHSLQSPRVNTNCKLIKLCTLAHTHTQPCFPYPSIQTHVEGLKSQRLRWWKWWWEMITHTSMRPPINYTLKQTHTHKLTLSFLVTIAIQSLLSKRPDQNVTMWCISVCKWCMLTSRVNVCVCGCACCWMEWMCVFSNWVDSFV